MAISLIANPAPDVSVSARTTVVLTPGACAAGDLVIVWSGSLTVAATLSIADTLGCGWAQYQSWTQGGGGGGPNKIWWGVVPAGGGSPSITVTCSASGELGGMVMVLRGTDVASPFYGWNHYTEAGYSSDYSVTASAPITAGDAVIVSMGPEYSYNGPWTAGSAAPNSNFTDVVSADGHVSARKESAIPWSGGTPTGHFLMSASSITGEDIVIFGVKVGATVYDPSITNVGTGTLSASNTTGGSLTPGLPAGLALDDLMICTLVGRPSGTAGTNDAITMPSGWTLIGARQRWEGGTYDLITTAYYKFAGASEGVPSITYGTALGTTGSNVGVSACISAFRNVDKTTPFDGVTPVGGTNAAATSKAPTGVTTITANDVVVSVVGTADDNQLALLSGSEQGFTLAYGGVNYHTTVGTDHAQAGAYKKIVTPGAVTVGTFTQLANGTDGWAFLTFALKQKPPSAATLTPVVMTLGAQALATAVGGVTASISPAIFTLTPVAVTQYIPPQSGSISPVVITLGPQALGKTIGGVTASISPAIFTLGSQALTTAVGGVSTTLGVPSITITTVALTKSVGTVSATLGVPSITITPVALSKSVGGVSATIGVPSITVTPVALTTAVGGTAGISISPAVFTLAPVVLGCSEGPVSGSISPVVFTIGAQAVTTSVGGVSRTLGVPTITLTSVALTTAIGGVSSTLGVATVTLSPVGLTATYPQNGSIAPVVLTITPVGLSQSIGGVSASVSPVTLSVTPVSITYSLGTVARTINPVTISITPVTLTTSVGTVSGVISPITLTYTSVGLTYSLGTSARSVTPVTITLTPIGFTYSIGGSAGISIDPVTISFNPFALSGFSLIPGEGNIGPAVFNLGPRPLICAGSGDVARSISPVVMTTSPQGLSGTPGTVHVSVGPVVFTFSPQGLTYSLGTAVGSINPAQLMVLAVALTGFVILGGKPKVWTGTEWVTKPVMVWTGSIWVEKPLKVWTGSEWELA